MSIIIIICKIVVNVAHGNGHKEETIIGKHQRNTRIILDVYVYEKNLTSLGKITRRSFRTAINQSSGVGMWNMILY